MPNTNLNILLKMKDTVSKPIAGIQGRLKSFASSFKKNWLGITALITASAIAINKAWGQFETSAKIKQQQTAFENLAASYGSNANKIIADLKRTSGATLSTIDIMTQASRAMTLGLNPEKFGQLMEISRAAAKAMGQDVGFMFESIVLGIGRQSKMILDNLGIIVKAEDAYKEYAETLGKTADKLTDVEKRQAFMNATIKAGEDIIKRTGGASRTQAENLQIMKAALVDAKNAMLLWMTSSADMTEMADNFRTLADSIGDIRVGRLIGEMQGLQNEIKDLVAPEGMLDKLKVKFFDSIGDRTNNNIRKNQESLAGVVETLIKMGEVIDPMVFKFLKEEDILRLQKLNTELNKTPIKIKAVVHANNAVGKSYTDAADKAAIAMDQTGARYTALNQMMAAISLDTNKLLLDRWVSVVESMSYTFGNVFYGIFTGTLKGLDEAFKAFGLSVLRVLAQIIAKMLIVWALGKLLGMFTGGLGAAAGAAGGGAMPVGFATGTPYVPETGLAMVHKGERITPAHQNDQGGGGGGLVQNFFISAWDAGDLAAKKNTIMGWMAEGYRTNAYIRQASRRYA